MNERERCARLPEALLPWYAQNARDLPWRRDREPYHVWISEIMLQQTRVEAVKGYYERFLREIPTIEHLAAVDEEKLLKLWEGLGYYSRARNLKKAARTVMTDLGGSFPADHGAILRLPGIGPYTAGAIASICFGQCTPAVDGNVLRVISRLTADDAPIDTDETKKRVSALLRDIYPAHAPGDFTQALMELGATVCTPRSPKCEICPARGFCLARERGQAAQYPVRAPKKEKRQEARTVFLLEWEGRFAIEKRSEKGLLSGLWQFPNQAAPPDAAAALRAAAEMGVRPIELMMEIRREHIFTHIRWDMTAYRIRCAEGAERFTWADREQLREKYALPTAFRQFLEVL